MRLPDFIVVGVRKCGTTWLHQCLSEHPAIYLPKAAKELFYFDSYWHRGSEWYARQFRRCDASQICGDVAPSCFANEEAARRIHGLIPKARLIFIFRDPVERVVSLYRHKRARGEMSLTLAEALDAHPALLEEGYYARHFAYFRRLFGAGALLPLLVDDVHPDNPAGLSPLFRFLQVDDRFTPPSLHSRIYEYREARSQLAARAAVSAARLLRRAGLHSMVSLAKSAGVDRIILRSTAPPPDPEPRPVVERLRALYHHQIEELSQMLDRDLLQIWGYSNTPEAGARRREP